MSDLLSNHTSAQRSCPSPKRVLLVDEQCGELSCLTQTLQERGCEVYCCNSYADGLRQLESKFFDFVVVCQGGPSSRESPCCNGRSKSTGARPSWL